MRIISFCADGIESAAKLGFYDWAEEQDADIICVQDLRAQEYDLQDNVYFPEGYFPYFFDSPQRRTNGVAIYCRQLPKAIMTGLGMGEKDMQARFIQADYENLSIACLLMPGASDADSGHLADRAPFLDHFLAHLDKIRNKRREFVFCGNWGIAHRAIDVSDSETASQQPGFLPEEQVWMERLFNQLGYVDAFREINGDSDEFTWWPGGRDKPGLRTDYQVVSAGLRGKIEYGFSYKNQQFSTHAPLIIDYDIELT
jgi:exodeoxyribonuclease-3